MPLIFAEDAIAAIVDDQQLGIQAMLACGEQFAGAIEEAAVTNDGERRNVGKGRLGTERTRPRIPERSRPERIKESARRERRNLRRRPINEDRHVPGGGGFAGLGWPNRFRRSSLGLSRLPIQALRDAT